MTQSPRLLPGLCSVTFRALEPKDIVSLARENAIKGIEWAGDVHVRPGDTKTARKIAKLCADNGIATPSYGSYVRARPEDEFLPALESCLALGASNIRIWAGTEGFAEASISAKQHIADTVRSYCETAKRHKIAVSLEYHPNTLTDSLGGTTWLLNEVANDNCFSYWQPVPEQSMPDCANDIKTLGNKLSHIHLFYWSKGRVREPLADGATYWADVLKTTDALPQNDFTNDRWAFMEFVRDDDPNVFAEDAQTFLKLLSPQLV